MGHAAQNAGAGLVSARGVTHRYSSAAGAVTVLHDVSLDVHAGELVLAMGPSGSGKTTLLSVLAALLRPTCGSVRLAGVEAAALGESDRTRLRRRSVGFVFQAFNLFPALSARDNVAEIIALKGTPIRAARLLADELLARTGMAHRADARPDELSGGERQRVAISRALAGKPALIFADEPTAALDGETADQILRLFRAHVGPATAALIVTHDHRLECHADRVIELVDGRITRIRAAGASA